MAENWKQDPGDQPEDRGGGYNMNPGDQSQSPAFQQYPGAAGYQHISGSGASNQFSAPNQAVAWNQMQDSGGDYSGFNNSYYQNSQQLPLMQSSDPSMMQQQQQGSSFQGAGNAGMAHGFELQQYQQHQQHQQYMLQQMLQSQQVYPSQSSHGSAPYHPGGVPFYGGSGMMDVGGFHHDASSATTTASMFGRKPSRPKKNKDKPKRPLSAYNIFFKDQRAIMLAGKKAAGDKKKEAPEEEGVKKEDEKVAPAVKTEESNEDGGANDATQEKDSDDGEDKKPTKKRKREPHGKVGFETMAKTIGALWKAITPDELEKYKVQAAEDMKRYKKEMDAFLLKQRQGLEESNESTVEPPADSSEVKEENEAKSDDKSDPGDVNPDS